MTDIKLVAHRSEKEYRKTFLDWNRLIKVTQRRFHCAWEELRGARPWITPRVASEVLSQGDPEDLANTRARAIEICEDASTDRLRRRDAAQDIWWIDEWTSPNGIVGLTHLDAAQKERRNELLEAMPKELFQVDSQDDVADHPDARITAEIVALDAELLLSSNFNTIDISGLNDWLHAHGHAQRDTRGPIHVVDDYLHECLTTLEQGRILGMQAVLASAWPEDRGSEPEEVIASAVEATQRMKSPGGHLQQTGTYLEERLLSGGWRGWVRETIERLRRHGAERVQGAQRRHPKYKAWTRKTYGDNTPELAHKLAQAKWVRPTGQLRMRVDERDTGYGLVWEGVAGQEPIDIGYADTAQTVAEVLAICGIQPESDKDSSAGGIASGREEYLKRDRRRAIER